MAELPQSPLPPSTRAVHVFLTAASVSQSLPLPPPSFRNPFIPLVAIEWLIDALVSQQVSDPTQSDFFSQRSQRTF